MLGTAGRYVDESDGSESQATVSQCAFLYDGLVHGFMASWRRAGARGVESNTYRVGVVSICLRRKGKGCECWRRSIRWRRVLGHGQQTRLLVMTNLQRDPLGRKGR